MLQEADSGKKVNFARQKIADLSGSLGDRDRNLGSGSCVRVRGDRGESVEIASHRTGREGGSRQKIVKEFFGNVIREDRSRRRQTCPSGRDGNTQRNLGEIRSKNRGFRTTNVPAMATGTGSDGNGDKGDLSEMRRSIPPGSRTAILLSAKHKIGPTCPATLPST